MINKGSNKLFKLEEEVKLILEEDEKTREDDMYLYFEYAIKKNPEVDFNRLFFDSRYRTHHKIRTFGAVERCGREIRKKYPKLNGKNQKIRFEEQKKYIDYSLNSRMISI